MGQKFSKNYLINSITSYVIGKKRKYSEIEDEENNRIIEIALHTPKKKKLTSTSEYIYTALFLEGKASDITVRALGKEFQLHKIYLCQSPYFASMFGGSWLETKKNYVKIDVVDPLITLKSLEVVFGSLYQSEITLNPIEVDSILATATMFQLDGLIDKCAEVMLETLNSKTAISYYNAACRCGDKKLQEVCFKWLLVNLMTYYYQQSSQSLRRIPVNLMTKLITHPDLFVMQTEYSLYNMLKNWIYATIKITNDEEQVTSAAVTEFFCSRKGDLPYLFTREGKEFMPAFRALRLHNLISHQTDVDMLLSDNIMPKNWLNVVALEEWKHVLRINQNDDKGPSQIADDVFLKMSMRCGRTLLVNERHVWRWTGFHFGVDLLMMSGDATISIKRNHRPECEQLLSFQSSRTIAIRVTVVKLNEQRQIIYMKQSEIQRLSLAKNEEVQLLTFDKDLEYPLIISANIVYANICDESINMEDNNLFNV